MPALERRKKRGLLFSTGERGGGQWGEAVFYSCLGHQPDPKGRRGGCGDMGGKKRSLFCKSPILAPRGEKEGGTTSFILCSGRENRNVRRRSRPRQKKISARKRRPKDKSGKEEIASIEGTLLRREGKKGLPEGEIELRREGAEQGKKRPTGRDVPFSWEGRGSSGYSTSTKKKRFPGRKKRGLVS